MRSICKKGSATLVAVLALCALAAASASASQWYVGGKALTGSEKLAETVKVEQPIKFTFHLFQEESENPTLTCTGMTSAKSEIGASGAIKLKEPALTGCVLVEPNHKNCELNDQTRIGLLPLEAKMALGKAPEDTAELAGTGTVKAWTEFWPNEECEELNGPDTIRGSVTIQAPKGQTEATEQEFVGEGSLSNGLKWYAQSVYFSGKFKLKLASGKAWSFH